MDVSERLYAGGARNRGIAATSARYVAFLAADSEAEPGWVAGRLRAHAEGADAVACALTSPPGASRSATAAHLLLNWRRMPGAEPPHRLLFGLSYDRRAVRPLRPVQRGSAGGRGQRVQRAHQGVGDHRLGP